MSAANNTKDRCYSILSGIEMSLGETLRLRTPISEPDYLSPSQHETGLKRLREDYRDEEWDGEITNEDLLSYLDLGHLLELLHRHGGRDKAISGRDSKKVSEISEELKLISIRKRVMHPIRPLEASDLPTLNLATVRLIDECPDLIWAELRQRMIQQESNRYREFNIPTWLTEDQQIENNLPAADFNETGFIGRQRDRSQLLGKLRSDQRVITVVGEAGTGKTALALMVANDLIEKGGYGFEKVVWVTLKTRQFQVGGIRVISDAIDTVGGLLRNIFDSFGVEESGTAWEDVFDSMKESKTLLIIDNLETLGSQLRDLFVGVPLGSKVLTTTRVGLGEIEERYPLPDFDTGSATNLFRALANAYNYTSLLSISNDQIKEYCRQVSNRPLLIKWFVHAIGNGADPKALPIGTEFQEALRFCYENVYDSLTDSAKKLAGILLASRVDLSRAQLQETMGIDHVDFEFIIQELLNCSMVEDMRGTDGSITFKIEGLVQQFLSKNHSPDDATVMGIRASMRRWKILIQEAAQKSQAFRYSPRLINAHTKNEVVAYRHLKSALDRAISGEINVALEDCKVAERLTPDWWEVFRIRAKVLIDGNAPIYDIEQEFERALELTDSDIPRYFYATFLIDNDECDRAIDVINQAIRHQDSSRESLLSQRGRALLRSAHLDEALDDFKEVIELSKEATYRSDKNGRVNLTQLAEVYRRICESAKFSGDQRKIIESITNAVATIDQGIEENGLDFQICLALIEVGGQFHFDFPPSQTGYQEILGVFSKWDDSNSFRRAAVSNLARLQRYRARLPAVLPAVFPNLYADLNLGIESGVLDQDRGETTKSVTGIIHYIHNNGRWGRIRYSTEPDRFAFFPPSSLVPNTKITDLEPGDSVEFDMMPAHSQAQDPVAVNIRIRPN